MAVTKASQFERHQVQMAGLAKAIAHPARIAILEILARKNTCICGDITEELPLAQSTVSQHLKALKKAGIIKGEINGPKICYCINEEKLNELNSLMADYFFSLLKQNQCC